MRTEARSRARSITALLLFLLALLGLNCQTSREDPSGGETHFLRRCSDANDCGRGLACLCGACTTACTETAACIDFPEASCRGASATDACAASEDAHCDVSCTTDEQCSRISAEHHCASGLCRRGGATRSACKAADAVDANQLVILGDSFFAANHRITAFLEDLARSRQAISASERYRDYSSVVGNTLALLGAGIADQYAAAKAEGPTRVVVMTGGGADVLLGSCDVVSDACPVLTAAVAAATSLLQRMAEDGVEHVVYAFYPDPSEPTLRAEVAALRPLLEAACRDSPAPCAWVDLRPAFDGHEEEYLDAEGTVPTADGARASAEGMWSVMSANCIAQ